MRKDFSTVAVVGMGKIGLPLAVQFAQHGKRVIGCDINPMVVEMINAGHAHILEEPGLEEGVAAAVQQGLLSATTDTSRGVSEADVVVVIVPVIINAEHEVDFRVIDAATAAVGAGLQPGTLVTYETTLPIGTTAIRLRCILERESGLRAGQDFFLAYSPERVMSGTIFRDLRLYPKAVSGIDEQSCAAAVEFYSSVLVAPILSMASTNEAEFVKLIETSYRDVNIALANEFACFADAFGLDVSAAIAAANTHPYSHIHTPGVGVGGHCIPVYPYFLLSSVDGKESWNHGSPLPMLTLPRYARRVNDAMAEYSIQRIEAVTGPLEGQSVLILGAAYRGDVHEPAFTSAKLLQEALIRHDATVYIDDPLFSDDELRDLGYTPIPSGSEDEVRAIILQADHRAYQSFDFTRFTSCQVVLDGRRALEREKIALLGMHYMSIGDGNPGSSQEMGEEHFSTQVLLSRQGS